MLRISNWNARFENNRTRELKTMLWVPIEILDDGAYSELVEEHRNGAAHYGAWIAIVKIAGNCVPRGTLVKYGPKGKAVPHDAKSLSRISGMPKNLFSAVIPRLLEIGWLEQDPESTQLGLFPAGNSQEDRTGGKEGGRGGKEGGRKVKPGSSIPPSPDEVSEYATSIGFALDGAHFCDYYEQAGWNLKRGSKMKNWQAAVRTWKAREEGTKTSRPPWEKGMITQEQIDAETPEQKAEKQRKIDEHNRRVLER